MKLPCMPGIESTPTEPPKPKPAVVEMQPATTSGTSTIMKVDEVKVIKGVVKKGWKKKKEETSTDKPTKPTGTSAKGQMFAENSNWNPNSSSLTGKGPYPLPSFDARQIIYPGANRDVWWDMPQLIAQVSILLCLHNLCAKT